jgi:hypothetical protein
LGKLFSRTKGRCSPGLVRPAESTFNLDFHGRARNRIVVYARTELRCAHQKCELQTEEQFFAKMIEMLEAFKGRRVDGFSGRY